MEPAHVRVAQGREAGMIRSESVTGTPTLALPPGTLGLPYLGETLAFLRNPFRFLEDRQRRHGHVWKSRLLGRRIVFLSGTEGARAFYDPQQHQPRGRAPVPAGRPVRRRQHGDVRRPPAPGAEGHGADGVRPAGHRRLPAGDAGVAGAGAGRAGGAGGMAGGGGAAQAGHRGAVPERAGPGPRTGDRGHRPRLRPDAAGPGVGPGGAARHAVRPGPGRPRSPAGDPAPDHRRAPSDPRATTPCRASCRRRRPTGARSPTRRRCWRSTTSSSRATSSTR